MAAFSPRPKRAALCAGVTSVEYGILDILPTPRTSGGKSRIDPRRHRSQLQTGCRPSRAIRRAFVFQLGAVGRGDRWLFVRSHHRCCAAFPLGQRVRGGGQAVLCAGPMIIVFCRRGLAHSMLNVTKTSLRALLQVNIVRQASPFKNSTRRPPERRGTNDHCWQARSRPRIP